MSELQALAKDLSGEGTVGGLNAYEKELWVDLDAASDGKVSLLEFTAEHTQMGGR